MEIPDALKEIQEAITSTLNRIYDLETALRRIVALDPEADTDEGFNEWGEAECFNIAQKIAKEALKDE